MTRINMLVVALVVCLASLVLQVGAQTPVDSKEAYYAQFRANATKAEYELDLNGEIDEFIPFFGNDVDTKRFVMVMDISGSMNWASYVPGKTRLQLGKEEFNNTISHLNEDDDHKFGIVNFNYKARYWENPTELTVASESNKDKAQNYVDNLKASGNTNLYDGLDTAGNYYEADHIFLLSDGEPTSGPRIHGSYQTAILKMLHTSPKFTTKRIVAVWIGNDNQSAKAFLRKVANDFEPTDPRFDPNRPRGIFDDKSQ